MSSTQAELVRKSFRNFVFRNGGDESSSLMLETTLIRDGAYCGRKFSLFGYSIIWFIDEQQIKLFDQNGSLLQSMPLRDFCLGIPASAIPAATQPENGDPREIRRAA
jgi:hypothetical protein